MEWQKSICSPRSFWEEFWILYFLTVYNIYTEKIIRKQCMFESWVVNLDVFAQKHYLFQISFPNVFCFPIFPPCTYYCRSYLSVWLRHADFSLRIICVAIVCAFSFRNNANNVSFLSWKLHYNVLCCSFFNLSEKELNMILWSIT